MERDARIRSIERATGRSWDEWLQLLDSHEAKSLDHKQIALRAYEVLEHAIEKPGWWAQGVAVAYEQHIGRRVPGQSSDGTFQMSVSKATSSGMEELMEQWRAFAAQDEDVQEIVIADGVKVSGTVRRITWRAKAQDGSSVIVTSEPKKNGTASIIAAQRGLPTPECNEESRSRWKAIIERFMGERQPGGGPR